MKHLVMMIQNMYPNRHFRISEDFRTDEVYNVEANYELHIEGIIYNYVLKLYDKEKL